MKPAALAASRALPNAIVRASASGGPNRPNARQPTISNANASDSVAEALAIVPGDARVLIFGSLYLAGSVLAANDQIPD